MVKELRSRWRVDFVCSIRCPATFARARAGIMDMRGKRAARAYRNFVVEITWDRHMQTLLLAAVACAVSLARHPAPLTLPFLTEEDAFGGGGAGALARAVGRLLEPRWMGVVMYPSMFACAWLKPMWYAARFERACDLVHMLGLLTRHGLNFADSASTGENIIEKNFLTYLLRPAVVIISGLSLRYEFSKQWKVHTARLLLDVPLNAYCRSLAANATPGKVSFWGSGAGDGEGTLVDRLASLAAREVPEYAFMLGTICLVDFAFEYRDRAAFVKRVRREARYANAASVVAAEGSRRRQRGEGSSRDGARRRRVDEER